MKVPICCCCDAHLIGWVELKEEQLVKGTSIVYPIGNGERLEFEVAEITVGYEFVKTDILGLEDVTAFMVEPVSVLALKSKDYPIEKIRQISGFEEEEEGWGEQWEREVRNRPQS